MEELALGLQRQANAAKGESEKADFQSAHDRLRRVASRWTEAMGGTKLTVAFTGWRKSEADEAWTGSRLQPPQSMWGRHSGRNYFKAKMIRSVVMTGAATLATGKDTNFSFYRSLYRFNRWAHGMCRKSL